MAREPRDRPWIETGPGGRFIRALLWVGLVLAAVGLVLGLATRAPWWQLALDCAVVANLVALLVMNRPNLLESTDDTVERIAAQVGFGNHDDAA